MTYDHLDFTLEELQAAMRAAYDDLIAFITTPEFKALHREVLAQSPSERPAFVVSEVVDKDRLRERGIEVPEDILIQTSAFGDRRPTLFAVKKFLPEKFHRAWENVNWTFDNIYPDEEVSRDPKDAWRPPLPVVLQNAIIADGGDLQSVPTEKGVNFSRFSSMEASADAN